MKSLTVCVAVSFIILEKSYEMVKHAGFIWFRLISRNCGCCQRQPTFGCHSFIHTSLWGSHLLVLYPYKAWPIEELNIG